MSVRRSIPVYDGVFFISLTCCRWLCLFEIANAYYAVYKWFDHLKKSGHFIIGYVIMPNHLHAILAFRNTQGLAINRIVGSGKRFMAYEIVNELERLKKREILEQLASCVNSTDRKRKKLHEVFEPSFDWKECRTDKFIVQKLDYVHENPCRGKWHLVENFWEYRHSSAKYYVTGEQGIYPVTNYGELKDIDLTRHFEDEAEDEVSRGVPETGDSAGN